MYAYWYIAMIVAFANLLGYTMRFQGATLYWGKALAPDNPLLPRGMQDAITPRSQTVRNIILMPSGIVLAVAGFFWFQWYIVLGAIFVALIGSGFVSVLLPRPESGHFWNVLLGNLHTRRLRFEGSRDFERFEAINDLAAKLEALRPHLKQR